MGKQGANKGFFVQSAEGTEGHEWLFSLGANLGEGRGGIGKDILTEDMTAERSLGDDGVSQSSTWRRESSIGLLRYLPQVENYQDLIERVPLKWLII